MLELMLVQVFGPDVHERCWAHVRHLEALLQPLLNHRHGFGIVAGQKKVVNIEGQVDPSWSYK